MGKLCETELSSPVKELFRNNGYSIHSEVETCDIVAKKDDILIIVELKLQLNLNLLIQAVKRQKLTDHVFIAIPKPTKMRKWHDFSLLIKRLGLGLIFVYLDDESYAEIVFEPGLFDIRKSQKQSTRKRNNLLKEFTGRSEDLNIGGSTRKKIMTSYKEQSLYIASCLKVFGDLSPKQLKELGADFKKTNSILTKNFNNWFYRIKVGLYGLTKAGEEAITTYHIITNSQIEKLINIKSTNKVK